MAQVDRATRADVDHLLKWATAAWKELPEVEREIDSWDLLAQLVFTEAQRARYRELLKLVDERRPIIERIMQG